MAKKNAMKNNLNLKIRLEIIWWIITALVVVGILYPIVSSVDNYQFLIENIVFIVVLITLTRYIFLLKHTFLAKINWLKLVLIFLCIPLLAYLFQSVNNFQTFLDNLLDTDWENAFGSGSHDQQNKMHSYIRAEMLLFGVGAIIVSFLFPIRMVISIWRQINRGTT